MATDRVTVSLDKDAKEALDDLTKYAIARRSAVRF